MTEQQQANFEGWAIVELMGHQQEIGFVTTQAFGQAVLFRIDQPELGERDVTLSRPEWMELGDDCRTWPAGTKVKRSAVPARSRLVAPGALYAINPCTEEAARAALEKTHPRKLALVEMPANMAALPAPTSETDDSDLCVDCGKALYLCACDN